MQWQDLVGLEIAALRGVKEKVRHPLKGQPTHRTELSYILLKNGKSYIMLSAQDQAEYHDCNKYARGLDLIDNAENWQKMMNKEEGYDEADYFPF